MSKEWQSLHRAHTASRIQTILDAGLFSDVTVQVEGVFFKCHRYVLASISQFFLSEFSKRQTRVAGHDSKILTAEPNQERELAEEIDFQGRKGSERAFTVEQEKLLQGLGTPAKPGITKTEGDFVDVDISNENSNTTPHEASGSNFSVTSFQSHVNPSSPSPQNTARHFHDIIKLDFLSSETFRVVLKAAYFGQDSVTEVNVIHVYKAAARLQISSLSYHCEQIILNLLRLRQLDAYTIVYDLEMGESSAIMRTALEVLLTDFNVDSCKAEWFLNLSPDMLFFVLDDPRLNVRHEDEVYRALTEWYEHDPISREEYMEQGGARIRLANLSRRMLVEEALPRYLLFSRGANEREPCNRNGHGDRSDVNLQQLVQGALMYQLLPDRRHDEELSIAEFRPSQASERVLLVLGDKADQLYGFSFSRKAWFKLAPPPKPFGLAPSGCSHGEDLYVSGGDKAAKSFYRYRAETNSWKQLGDMVLARRSHCSVAVGDVIFVLGGKDDKQSFKRDTLDSVEMFDLHDKSRGWKEIPGASLPVPVRSMAAAVLGEKVYMFGGRTNGIYQTVDAIQCFDTRTLQSHLIGHLPTPSCLARTVFINKVIHIVDTDGEILRFLPQHSHLGDKKKEIDLIWHDKTMKYSSQDLSQENVERRLQDLNSEIQNYSSMEQTAVTYVGKVFPLNWKWFGLARDHDGTLYVVGGELPKESSPSSLRAVCKEEGIVREVVFTVPGSSILCYVSASVCIQKAFMVEKLV